MRTNPPTNDGETVFAPPRASMTRVKMKDDDGRTMFEVYEPRYFGDEEQSCKHEQSKMPTHPSRHPARGATSEFARVVLLLERHPVAIIAMLFATVLLLSATVTALAIALARRG